MSGSRLLLAKRLREAVAGKRTEELTDYDALHVAAANAIEELQADYDRACRTLDRMRRPHFDEDVRRLSRSEERR